MRKNLHAFQSKSSKLRTKHADESTQSRQARAHKADRQEHTKQSPPPTVWNVPANGTKAPPLLWSDEVMAEMQVFIFFITFFNHLHAMDSRVLTMQSCKGYFHGIFLQFPYLWASNCVDQTHSAEIQSFDDAYVLGFPLNSLHFRKLIALTRHKIC